MIKKVYLANPSGFCAGVKYAISYLEKVHESQPGPVYVRKEIVHNQRVVNDLKKKGIKFVNELSEVPDNSTVVFSAHGVSPKVTEQAQQRGMKIGDATCPLVTRVHKKAKRISDDHQIIYIGHKGHDEAEGTMGEADMFLVENEQDVEKLREIINPDKPLTYLMQTTLSLIDTKNIIDRITEIFPNVEHPDKNDICYATTQRQQAVGEMLDHIDAMIVIGSSNSSNTLRLLELAGTKRPKSFRISSADDLDLSTLDALGLETIGITAGASSPRVLIDETLARLRSFYPGIEVLPYPGSEEDTMSFKTPKNLIK